ncbi:pyridine nucleotide-disulfide oxidoreductase [Solimonas fluminis]|uniref:Pyridine nucleotide-disulfide oxidoreductase n=1 Tax=Solimonas fluminis TaxID=2086571 RepID=A0A2S5TBZ6_9GAMM|nr:FAD-dependent oxidoreductase [Solimonas fluminis]PPE72533.1 pyridine nucleotide-disulfide oxidoreductase [Solimonas fluminis]
MTEQSDIVVIGAGQAGAELCLELRRRGHAGRVVLLGDEAWPPYKRPPLSKAYLTGAADEAALYAVPPAQWQRHAIEFIGGTAAVRLDRQRREVELADGRRIGYRGLALTTGGRARPLPVPGAGLRGVQLLRTMDDARALRPALREGCRLVIVGGGFIGLEAAAAAARAGARVTLLEGLDRVLARVTAPEISRFFERVHREAGVNLVTGAQLAAVRGRETVEAVQLSDGRLMAADHVLAGIGLLPNVELAQRAGLEVDDGIVVDECARSSDPHIVSAGDCANHPSRFAGRRLRLESVQNALEQARTAAATLLGADQPYRAVPWFWSDQYDLKLQMVGLSQGHDRLVVRGDLQKSRDFSAFYLREGRLIAADVVNRPQEFLLAKKLVAAGAMPDPARLADGDLPLRSLLAC